MIKLLAIVLAVTFLVQPAYATISLLSACGAPGGSPDCTSTGIDTTGATLLVLVNGTNTNTCSITETGASNTWTPVVNVTGGGFSGTYTLCYVENPNTSSTHKFTCAGTLCGIVVGAYSGTLTSGALDTSCSGNSSNPSKCAASLTAANDGSLFYAGMGGPYVDPLTLTTLTIQEKINGVGGVSYGADFGDYVQPTIASLQPQWDDAVHGTGVMLLAIFKPSAGGGGSTLPPMRLLQGVGK